MPTGRGATWPVIAYPVGVRGGQQLELAAVGVAAHLHQRERHRPARLLGHAPEDRELGVDVGEVGDALQHALAGGADRPRDADQLVGFGRERGCELTLARAVVERARRGEPERAGFDALTRDPRHRLDVVGRGDFPAGAALPHHVEPQRAVRHLHRDVDVEGPPVERVHELGERLPVPGETLLQHHARDVLDALHQLDEPVVISRAHRREPDAAVADDDRRDTVPRRRDHPLAPRRLAVVVRVDVDEAGRDEKTVGVDRALGGAADLADLGDDTAVDRDVGGACRRTGAVNNRPAANDRLVRAHTSSVLTALAGVEGALASSARLQCGRARDPIGSSRP